MHRRDLMTNRYADPTHSLPFLLVRSPSNTFCPHTSPVQHEHNSSSLSDALDVTSQPRLTLLASWELFGVAQQPRTMNHKTDRKGCN